MFIHHLIKLLEKILATQIYDQQKDLDFLGLVKECKDLIQYYNLLDTTNTMSLPSKNQWQSHVKDKIKCVLKN